MTAGPVNGFGIAGWGTALPERIVSNSELAARFGVGEDWIFSRCGIRERRAVRPGQTTASLAVAAGRGALEKAGMDGGDIAHLIVATATPEQPSPATSAFVHHELGIAGSAHDLNAECAGFVYGLVSAMALMALDPRPILLIGSDTHTLTVRPDDRDLGILVGDGAGAVVLTPRPDHVARGWNLGADGSCNSSLKVLAGGSRLPTTEETVRDGLHYAQINGNEIYLNAVRYTVHTVRATLESAKAEAADVDHIVPHQANIRIINSVLQHTGLPPERLVSNLERYGNTASASVPIALAEALDAGRIREGELVLLAGFGAGMTWGSMLLEWGGP
ncbi:3-oxoacyl-ACP synthase III family protein [Streptomonospora sediminis]